MPGFGIGERGDVKARISDCALEMPRRVVIRSAVDGIDDGFVEKFVEKMESGDMIFV